MLKQNFTFLLFHHKDTFTFILYQNYDTPYLSLQRHMYLHLYYTRTTIPHIFHCKDTCIYIYTIPELRFPISFIAKTHVFTFILYQNYDTPYLSLQRHMYLHLYYTRTTIPHIFHCKDTCIYIYTIPELRYPISFIAKIHVFTFILYQNYDSPYLSLQRHMYLHLYYTRTTIPHIFHCKDTCIYIYTIPELRHPISFIAKTHVFTFILYQNYDTPYLSLQRHMYLHLYYTSTTIPHIFHHKHTHIYIYPIQQLRYPISSITKTRIYTVPELRYSQGLITILCLYPWDHLGTRPANP